MLTRIPLKDEKGASAVLVAASLIMLMGFAAVALDLGAGFNERRQDQSAADTAVVAGALSILLEEGSDSLVTEVLDIARSNLDTTYDDAAWQNLWRSCVDPGRTSWDHDGDPGTAPISFMPLTEPSSWGASQPLDCVSISSSFLRVRIPDQDVATSFGRVLGVDTLTTSAVAIVRLEPATPGGLLPFGVVGGATAGELCLKSSGSGTAYPPCSGPSSGGFGEIDSEIFHDFFDSPLPECGLPGHPELAQNIALGIDHFVDTWGNGSTNPAGVPYASAHPGDGTVESYPGVVHDQCRIVGGIAEPQVTGEIYPVNMLRVGTGFSPDPVKEGLISNSTFGAPPQPSRLQQGTNTKRTITDKQGGSDIFYQVDNKGPWEYLTSAGGAIGIPECDPATYGSLTTEDKVARFSACLVAYETGGETTDIFGSDLAESPRMTWTPQYWHQASTSGVSWQPVHGFRMVFLGGLYFNCSGTSCGIVFYPDSSETAPLCDPAGAGCKSIGLDQLSGWLLPDEAVPDEIRSSFPGGAPFQVTLYR